MQGVELKKYSYVTLWSAFEGDAELKDLMMQVENEISNTKLQRINKKDIPLDWAGKTLAASIDIKSEKWDGGHTYITISFEDVLAEQNVAVIKSSGIGFSIAHDKKLALRAIRRKLQTAFGVNSSISEDNVNEQIINE